MFPLLRRHWTLWTAWVLATSVLLFANPWIEFSWAELAACLGSLAIAVDRRVRRERLLVAGILAIALLAIVDPTPASAPRLLIDAVVFVGAVLLGARAVDDQIELESIAGHLALGPDAERAFHDFTKAVTREIGRARRHDRRFILLSIARDGRSAVRRVDALGAGRVADRITEARELLELRELMIEELHLYAEVVATADRVLCLIPEVEEGAIAALARRLRTASLERLGLPVAAGVACFPRDALAVEDLIEAADAARRTPTLETVPGPAAHAEEHGKEPVREHPKAHVKGLVGGRQASGHAAEEGEEATLLDVEK